LPSPKKKKNFSNSSFRILHLEFEGDVRVYLDYPEVRDLMKIRLP
jgi:hypothetical protein